MKEILDHEQHLSRHFQKIIRGYNMEEMKVGKLILQCTAILGIIVYYFSNLIAKLMTSKKTILDQYFKNIQ